MKRGPQIGYGQYRIIRWLFLPDYSPAACARTVVRAEHSELCAIAISAYALEVDQKQGDV